MIGEELKHALINYHQVYRWWGVNSDRILCITYEMEGVKGIRYDKEMSKGGSPINIDEKMLNLIAIKDELIVASKHYEKMVNEVHDFIEWLEEPYKQMVIDKHFNDFSKTKMSIKYSYSEGHIYYIINGLIDKYTKSKNTSYGYDTFK